MSTAKAAIQNPPSQFQNSLKGFWVLQIEDIKDPGLKEMIKSFEVVEVVNGATGASAIYGQVNTVNGTALDLQAGKTQPSGQTLEGELVSFEITIDRVVYQFVDGLRLAATPKVIRNGRIRVPDRQSDGGAKKPGPDLPSDAEVGSWSAGATPVDPVDEKGARRSVSPRV